MTYLHNKPIGINRCAIKLMSKNQIYKFASKLLPKSIKMWLLGNYQHKQPIINNGINAYLDSNIQTILAKVKERN